MRVCDIEGCGGKHKGNGLCARHYQETKRREQGKPEWKPRGKCSVSWCDSVAHAHGLCSNHYQIKKRNGDPEAYHRARNGEGTQGPGTRMISTEYGQEYEHIVICRDAYGDIAGAVIHHLDGNQKNNTLSNLVVCSGQDQHMRIHWWQSTLLDGIRPPEYLPAGAQCSIVLGHTNAVKEYRGMLFDVDGAYVPVPSLPDSYGLGVFNKRGKL